MIVIRQTVRPCLAAEVRLNPSGRRDRDAGDRPVELRLQRPNQ